VPSEVTLRPTIDRAWLETLVEEDPSLHAFSLWDLDRYPTQVRFVSARVGERTVGYLLIWLGLPRQPIVQWFGESAEARSLAEALPTPPVGVVVPETMREFIEPRLGAVEAVPLRLLEVPREAPLPEIPTDPSVRTLVAADYGSVDPSQELVWGYFEEGRLRGVARRSVVLPRVWVITGVYVDPACRSRGFGLAIIRALLDAGHRAKATVALYVRADRPAPQAVYAKAGFRERARRVWLGASTTLEP
jgi:ribosomal protein S18 acetylase RimI-like enzyme